ncbi:MAG TPA: rhodanese-like domain-containing protein [Azospirillum sp.]|nr:rhodanese-like domain-containing protein [Azospirillum sp.]
MMKWLAVAVALVAVNPAFAGPYQPVDKVSVPDAKRTAAGLYVTAPEAHAMKTAGAGAVLFLDIRTRGEFMFLGSPTVTDANVPYVEMEEPPTWDAANKRYKLSHNSDFVAAVAARMEKRGLGKGDPIILLCRSGDRSARAADLLQQVGFSRVYSVLDGFEGDLGKEGRRDVNGWKNADLPWTYQMDEGKAYLR